MNPWNLLITPNLRDVTDRLAARTPLTGKVRCLEEQPWEDKAKDPGDTMLPKELRPEAYSNHVNGRIHDRIRDQTVFRSSKPKKYG